MLLLACFALLQAAGPLTVPAAVAVVPTPPKPTLGDPLPAAGAARAEWEIFPSRRAVIPLGRQVINVPILMYHYIRWMPLYPDVMGYKLSVTPADFQEQLDWLAANGYHAIDFSDLRAYFAGRQPLPIKPVVITLDDGYRDLYTTAYPMLHAHHFKAVAYIVSSFVGRSGYATADQVLEMDRGGIEIASHTVDHPNLARAPWGYAMYELTEAKAWLERLVGHPVLDFAYPSGRFTSQVISAVQQAGYDTAVTEQSSTLHSLGNRYSWARVRVGGGEGLTDFVQGLGPVEPSVVITEPGDQFDADAPSLPRTFQLLPPVGAGANTSGGLAKPRI